MSRRWLDRGFGLVVLAACSSHEDGVAGDASPAVDAEVERALECLPVNGTPCDDGDKCTFVRTEVGAAPMGYASCYPAGTVELGGACTWGPTGAVSGWDDCAAGLYCAAPVELDQATGTCEALCGLSYGACADPTMTCVDDASVMPTGVFGLCRPTS